MLSQGRLASRAAALDLDLDVRVNGETWSQSTTRDMFWSIGELIAHASRDCVLVPGEVIGTGTVGGGRVFEDPSAHPWLRDGDVVEVTGDRLGTLRQTVREHAS